MSKKCSETKTIVIFMCENGVFEKLHQKYIPLRLRIKIYCELYGIKI